MLNVPFGEIVAARFGFGTQQHGGYVHDNLNDVEVGKDVQKFGRVQVRVTAEQTSHDRCEARRDAGGR